MAICDLKLVNISNFGDILGELHQQLTISYGTHSFLSLVAHRYLLFIAFLGEWSLSGNEENTKKQSWHGGPIPCILSKEAPDKAFLVKWSLSGNDQNNNMQS